MQHERAEHRDDERAERLERAETLHADDARDDAEHGERDEIDDPVQHDDERLERDADEVAELRHRPVAHLAERHPEADRDEDHADDFAIVRERAEQAARDVFEKLREHARLSASRRGRRPWAARAACPTNGRGAGYSRRAGR